MAEEKGPPEAPKKRRPYVAGALLITITVVIVAILTIGIAYGVRTMVGGKGEVEEGVLVDGVREFRIRAPQWVFEPGVIRVNPGDTVRFIVTSPDIMHGFAINELNVNLALSPNEEVVREVVIPPEMPQGTYTIYCSIFCGIGHPYMKGSIIVGTAGAGLGEVLPYIATSIMAVIFVSFIVVWRLRATR